MRSFVFPYPILSRDLELSLEHVWLDKSSEGVLDQQDISDVVLEAGTRQIFAWADERKDWDALSISMQVEIPEGEIGKLADVSDSFDVVAAANSGKSNLRQTWELRRSDGLDYRWSGTVKLDRRQYFGTVTLGALLTGTTQEHASRFYAESPAWKIHLDEAQSPPIHGAIPIRWANFQEDKVLTFLRTFANEMHYLVIEDSEPTLYLNKGFDGLPELFSETSRPTGSRLGLFNSVSSSIAKGVWLALFQTAAVRITKLEQDGEYDWPDVHWQKNVLQQLLPHIYPDQVVDAALQEAGEEMASGRINRLQSEALGVISQNIIKEGKSIRKAIHHLERELQER